LKTIDLQLGGMYNWLYAVMTIFTQRFYHCNSKFKREYGVICHPLVTRLATVTDGSVVLPWSFCCKCKPVAGHAGYESTNLAWLAKSATDSKMRKVAYRLNQWYSTFSLKEPNADLHLC